MKWTSLVLFVIAAVTLLPSSAKPDSQPCGGFQLLAATVTVTPGKGVSPWDEHRVFMVNSATGETWEYTPAFFGSNGKVVDAGFNPIPVRVDSHTDKSGIDFQPASPQKH